MECGIILTGCLNSLFWSVDKLPSCLELIIFGVLFHLSTFQKSTIKPMFKRILKFLFARPVTSLAIGFLLHPKKKMSLLPYRNYMSNRLISREKKWQHV